MHQPRSSKYVRFLPDSGELPEVTEVTQPFGNFLQPKPARIPLAEPLKRLSPEVQAATSSPSSVPENLEERRIEFRKELIDASLGDFCDGTALTIHGLPFKHPKLGIYLRKMPQEDRCDPVKVREFVRNELYELVRKNSPLCEKNT